MPSSKDPKSPKCKLCSCYHTLATVFISVCITVVLMKVFGCEKFNLREQKNSTNFCLETCEDAENLGIKSNETTKPLNLANTELETTYEEHLSAAEKEFETNRQKVESESQEICNEKLNKLEEEYVRFIRHPTIQPISAKYTSYLNRCPNKQCKIKYKNTLSLQTSFHNFLEAEKRKEYIDENNLNFCPTFVKMCD